MSENGISSPMDGQFAFQRSEMLRQFQTQLLTQLSHELRGPLNSQLGSLDLILSNLCDSVDEVREFVAAARDSASQHLQLIQDCIELSRYTIPIQPLQLQEVKLSPILANVYRVTHLLARDRGIELIWPEVAVAVQADPHGLEQVLLGVSLWYLQQAIYGTIRLEAAPHIGGVKLTWRMNGQYRENPSAIASPNWQVSLQLMREMGGELSQMVSVPGKAMVVECALDVAANTGGF
jgi:hypothetical protein